MPLTDNNLNKEAFGETRTFAVAEHSADTMKARINRDNSQALRAKKQSLNNVTVFGMGAQDGGHALDRRVQHHDESAGQ